MGATPCEPWCECLRLALEVAEGKSVCAANCQCRGTPHCDVLMLQKHADHSKHAAALTPCLRDVSKD